MVFEELIRPGLTTGLLAAAGWLGHRQLCAWQRRRRNAFLRALGLSRHGADTGRESAGEALPAWLDVRHDYESEIWADPSGTSTLYDGVCFKKRGNRLGLSSGAQKDWKFTAQSVLRLALPEGCPRFALAAPSIMEAVRRVNMYNFNTGRPQTHKDPFDLQRVRDLAGLHGVASIPHRVIRAESRHGARALASLFDKELRWRCRKAPSTILTYCDGQALYVTPFMWLGPGQLASVWLYAEQLAGRIRTSRVTLTAPPDHEADVTSEAADDPGVPQSLDPYGPTRTARPRR
jgi:hypothetical protein